jgi:drug/metabolite transporter (DMT)-like permease
VSALALALVLTSAVAARELEPGGPADAGRPAFVWLGALAAAVLYAPLAVAVALVGEGRVSAAGLAFMAGSGVIHSAYFLALQRGYATGDLSLVYPLARGTGPVLSVAGAVLLLGERPGPLALAGAGLIVVAVLPLSGGVRHEGAEGAVAFALLTGALIAAYTLWDAHASGSRPSCTTGARRWRGRSSSPRWRCATSGPSGRRGPGSAAPCSWSRC